MLPSWLHAGSVALFASPVRASVPCAVPSTWTQFSVPVSLSSTTRSPALQCPFEYAGMPRSVRIVDIAPAFT